MPQPVAGDEPGDTSKQPKPGLAFGRASGDRRGEYRFLGRTWSLRGVSGALLYLVGVAGEIFVLTSVYLVMPVGPPSWRHCLVGGITATILWEITRHVLVWYFGTLSQVNVVYGSLTTSIVVLLSFEIAATVLLLGAQVIAEYERIGTTGYDVAPAPLRT